MYYLYIDFLFLCYYCTSAENFFNLFVYSCSQFFFFFFLGGGGGSVFVHFLNIFPVPLKLSSAATFILIPEKRKNQKYFLIFF